jgi:hypothetical protein
MATKFVRPSDREIGMVNKIIESRNQYSFVNETVSVKYQTDFRKFLIVEARMDNGAEGVVETYSMNLPKVIYDDDVWYYVVKCITEQLKERSFSIIFHGEETGSFDFSKLSDHSYGMPVGRAQQLSKYTSVRHLVGLGDTEYRTGNV